MPPTSDSFLLVLHSAKSRQFFPNNSSSSFSNILPSNFHLDGYDIALVQLSYYDNLRPLESYIPVPKTQANLFTDEDQKRVIVHSIKGNLMTITKSYNLYGEFITGLNASFAGANIKASVLVSYLPGGVPKTATLSYQNSNQYDLRLDSKLAKILGFSASVFRPGEYRSDLEISLSKFRLLSLTEEFEIALQRWETDTVTLDDITDPTLNDLGWLIISKLAEFGHQISFLVDEDDRKLIIDTRSSNKYITFSPFLMKRMGIPDNIKIAGRTVIDVLPNVIDPYSPFKISYLRGEDKKGFFSSRKMLVLCSLLDQNYFEKETLPVLFVCNRSVGTDEKIVIPSNPIYLPIGVNDTASVNIRLVSDTLQEIPQREFPTVAVIHCKKRWIA